MSAADQQVYIHPHHGAALRVGDPVERKVGDEIRLMQVLEAGHSVSWSKMMGLSGGALLTGAEVRTMVPLDKLEAGESPWVKCPPISTALFLNELERRPVSLWVTRVDMPHPANMLDRARSHLSTVGTAPSPERALAEVIGQVIDYLTVWHMTWLTGNSDHAQRRRGILASLLETLAGEGDFWAAEIGQTYTLKASGRDMLSMLGRAVATISVATGDDSTHIAHSIDAIASRRTRAHADRLWEISREGRLDAPEYD